MIDYKRITLLCGHYGSGKTNIAVNMAFDLAKTFDKVTIADLDIVNPYFRSKDSAADFDRMGIRLVCSEYANSNVDIPALPSDIYSLTADKTARVIIDVGGDDRGALALGRIRDDILAENDYNMLMVVNCYRPLTRDLASTLEAAHEIESAARIKFTGVINNSNLGALTTVSDVLASLPYANACADALGVPLVATAADQKLIKSLEGETDTNLFPLRLQNKIF